MKRPEPTVVTPVGAPPLPTVEEAEAALGAREAELGQLQALARGYTERWVVKPVEHRYLSPEGPHGTVVTTVVDTPRLERHEVSRADAIRARRQLGTAEEEVELARAVVGEAKTAAREAEQQRRADLDAEGTARVRADLPEMIRDLRAIQRKVQTFGQEMDNLDHRIDGNQRWGPCAWAPMRAGGALDFWIQSMCQEYGLDA